METNNTDIVRDKIKDIVTQCLQDNSKNFVDNLTDKLMCAGLVVPIKVVDYDISDDLKDTIATWAVPPTVLSNSAVSFNSVYEWADAIDERQ